MTIDQRGLVNLYREQFLLFASKVFGIVNPGTSLVPTLAFLAMAHALAEVEAGRTRRLLITVPPRSGKSLLASVALPAFMLGRDPRKRIVCASYSSELATKFARDCRMVMANPSYRSMYPATVIGKNTETELETAHGGSRFATSVGGTLTGRGGNLIVIDDPIKPDEAMSRLARQRVWDWFTGTAGSRLDDKSKDAIIVVMQRVHVDDLAGRLLDHGGWEHLCLPAIAEDRQALPIGRGRSIVRTPGDVLDPAREPLEVLEQLRRDLGTAIFEAQYQQQPVPEDGGLIKWSWFGIDDQPPSPALGDWYVMSWDTAMKSAEVNDYSVGIRALVKPNGVVHLLDIIRARLDYPTLRRRILEEARRSSPTITLIEDAGSGTSLLQDLRQSGIPLIGPRPNTDKVVRFQTITPLIEAGKVHLPVRALWLDTFRRELLSFPASAHDDQVDALSQLLGWMRDGNFFVPLQSRYSSTGR